MDAELARMRVDYRSDELDVGDLAATWHEQLTRWMDEASVAGAVEPNAMVLATTDDEGTPSARTVLRKGVDERGVVLYTNYTSAKSHDLHAHPIGRADLSLVRDGTAGLGDRPRRGGEPEESAGVLGEPPRGARLGAWAWRSRRLVADRSQPWTPPRGDRSTFRRHRGRCRCPDSGAAIGYAERVEFWQGRQGRMHDRLRFERDHVDGTWRGPAPGPPLDQPGNTRGDGW